MADRFSNFEDDEGDSGFGVQNTGSKASENGNGGTRRGAQEKSRQTTSTQASFDDFESDWDSDAPPSRGPSSKPISPHASASIPTSSSHSSQNGAPRATKNAATDYSTLELPKSVDPERVRALNLEDDADGQFGLVRAPLKNESFVRASAALQLRDFSMTPGAGSNEDAAPSRIHNNINRLADDYNEPSSSSHVRLEDDQMPPMPQVQYEPFSVEPPSHYQNYLYLLKYIHGLKILCGVHILYVTLALIFSIWYLMAGFIIAPFGFFAVHHLNRKLILIWAIAFAADTLAEGIGTLVMSSKPANEGGGIVPTLVHLLVVLFRCGLTYLIYRFWTKLPENAAEYFALFTSSSPEPDREDAV